MIGLAIYLVEAFLARLRRNARGRGSQLIKHQLVRSPI